MNPILRTIETKIENGEADREEVRDCADEMLQIRDEYPDVYSIISMANDETLEAISND